MIDTAYETTYGRQFKNLFTEAMDFSIKNILRRSDNILPFGEKENLFKISPEITTDELLPFRLPVSFTYRDKFYTVVDTRAFEGADGKIRQQRELDALAMRAKYMHSWIEEPSLYESVLPELSILFAEWMVQSITQRHGPTIAQQEIIRIYLACYYRTLMFTADDLKQVDADYLGEVLFKFAVTQLKMPRDFVTSVMEDENFIKVLNNLIAVGKSDLNNWLTGLNLYLDTPAIRLDSSALIILTVSASWMGWGAQDIAGTAIEYPPMLAYMANMAMTLGVYRRTKIGMAVEACKRRRVKMETLTSWAKEII